ncbi:MAG: NTP transferase domain-containing protein [Fervidicoccaceae archaeon]
MRNRVICVVMAGGEGRRFGNPEKFMEKVCGEPILSRLVKQLERLCVHIVLALSHRTEEVCSAFGDELAISCVELPGRDYVEDLGMVVRALPKPLLVAAADLVISYESLLGFVEIALELRTSIVTAEAVGDGSPSLLGLSLFHEERGEWVNVLLDGRSAVDVDERDDLERAERVCRQL